jgi:Holliday junction DNA helicase RuvB
MPTDLEILGKAFTLERRQGQGWNPWGVGANKSAIARLEQEGLIQVLWKTGRDTAYGLTEKGRGMVAVEQMERARTRIGAHEVLEALSLIKGFEDLKQLIAGIVEQQKRAHVLMEGPPASAKSLFLTGVQAAVDTQDCYLAFGSRTSAAGLSELLFIHQPSILLMDEVDKMRMDSFSVLLGLMETGDVIETKSRSLRGVKLDTVVLGACNDSSKLPREFLSRFALHAHFPHYKREDFLQVSEHFLAHTQGCPPELAREIGEQVFDRELGDVRKVRAVWELMGEPTRTEMYRVVNLMEKYSGRRSQGGGRAERLL